MLSNRQRRYQVMPGQLKKVAVRILNALGCPEGTQLSVSIVGDRTIRTINRDYLQKDRPTNVISFSLQEGEHAGLNPLALGDVIISVDTAYREAQAGGMELFERLCLLMLHGILHLRGYDHERSGEAEAAKMEKKQKQLFRMLETEGLLN